MPNPLSWYFHWGPEWTHHAGVWVSHFAEGLAPVGYFLPHPVASIAGVVTIAFQVLIMSSGNLSWLNLLTIVLAIPALDDGALRMLLRIATPELRAPATAHKIVVGLLAVLAAALSLRPIGNMLSPRQIMNTTFNPLHLVGTYGAFGGITRTRYEVVVEGTSDPTPGDASEWREYEFRGKPTATGRCPPQIAPYHLRLDWLMWFAAMSDYSQEPWFISWAGCWKATAAPWGAAQKSVSRSSAAIRARGALSLRVHFAGRGQAERPVVEAAVRPSLFPADFARERRSAADFPRGGVEVRRNGLLLHRRAVATKIGRISLCGIAPLREIVFVFLAKPQSRKENREMREFQNGCRLWE
jgi:hypothetical protein